MPQSRIIKIVAGCFGVVLVFVGINLLSQINLPSETEIVQLTDHFGVAGPLVLMLLVVLEVIVAPFPGTFIAIATGAVYGVWPGMLYMWAANVIGSTLTFFLSRKFGRPLVAHFMKLETIERYDAFLLRSRVLLWFIYAIPIFPIDGIGYLLGLSKMPYRKYAIVMYTGFAVNLFILTAFGKQLLIASEGMRIVYGLVIVAVFAIGYLSKKLFIDKPKQA